MKGYFVSLLFTLFAFDSQARCGLSGQWAPNSSTKSSEPLNQLLGVGRHTTALPSGPHDEILAARNSILCAASRAALSPMFTSSGDFVLHHHSFT
jgi:hypothetical protein